MRRPVTQLCRKALQAMRFIGVGSLSAAWLIRSFKVIWKPDWPVVVRQMRKVPRLPLTSSRISANISSMVSWRMALPEQDVPALDTIFSSPSLVKDAESVPPAIPGGWRRRQPTWLMRSFHKSLCGSGCCLSPNGCGISSPVIPICSITYYGFFLTVWRRRCNHAVRIRQTLPNNYCKIRLSRTSFDCARSIEAVDIALDYRKAV